MAQKRIKWGQDGVGKEVVPGQDGAGRGLRGQDEN